MPNRDESHTNWQNTANTDIYEQLRYLLKAQVNNNCVLTALAYGANAWSHYNHAHYRYKSVIMTEIITSERERERERDREREREIYI